MLTTRWRSQSRVASRRWWRWLAPNEHDDQGGGRGGNVAYCRALEAVAPPPPPPPAPPASCRSASRALIHLRPTRFEYGQLVLRARKWHLGEVRVGECVLGVAR